MDQKTTQIIAFPIILLPAIQLLIFFLVPYEYNSIIGWITKRQKKS